jgi:hypothetical protein
MKLLKIIGLGLAIWGMTLLWPEINQLLTPPITWVLVIGLLAVMMAYFLGQHFGQSNGNGNTGHALHTQPTRPVAVTAQRRPNSRPTLPLRSSHAQHPHSRPTRPMSGILTR